MADIHLTDSDWLDAHTDVAKVAGEEAGGEAGGELFNGNEAQGSEVGMGSNCSSNCSLTSNSIWLQKQDAHGTMRSGKFWVGGYIQGLEKEANRKGFIKTVKSDTKYATFVCRYNESSLCGSGHEKCPFFVSIAKIKSVEGGWRVTKSCLEHSAGHAHCTFQFPEGVKNAQNNQVMARGNRAAVIVLSDQDGQDFVKNQNPPRKQSVREKTVEAKVREMVSIESARRLLRKGSTITLEDQMLAPARVASLILQLKEIDPGGSYYYEVADLSYEFSGSSTESNSLYEFRRCAMIPSVCKQLFKVVRKIVAIDGAALRGDFGGVSLVMVGYYANNQTCVLAWAVVDIENGENWQWFLSLVFKDMGVPNLCISDKLSGLKTINEWIENLRKDEDFMDSHPNMELLVMSVCAVHVARNCGITGRDQISQVIRLALIADEGHRNWYLQNAFRISNKRGDEGFSAEQVRKLTNRLDDFTVVAMMKKGFKGSCLGTVTSNQAESVNNMTTHLRNNTIYGFVFGMLKLVIDKLEKFMTDAVGKDNEAVSHIVVEMEKMESRFRTEYGYGASVVTIDRNSDGKARLQLRVGPARSAIHRLPSSSYDVFIIAFPRDDCQWEKHVVCSCNSMHSYGRPCPHAALGVMHFHEKLRQHKKNASEDEKLLIKELYALPNFRNNYWYDPEFHSSAIDKQKGVIRVHRQLFDFVKSVSPGLPGERKQDVQQVMPWSVRGRVGRAKDQKAFLKKVKQARESQEGADKSEADNNGRCTPPPIGSLHDAAASPLLAPTHVVPKRSLACGACGETGHNISGCKRPSAAYMLDKNPGTKNKILRGKSAFISQASTFTSASMYLAPNDVLGTTNVQGITANLSMDANENNLFSNVFKAFGTYGGSDSHLLATNTLKKHLLERKRQSKRFISEDYLDYLNVYVRLNWDGVQKPKDVIDYFEGNYDEVCMTLDSLYNDLQDPLKIAHVHSERVVLPVNAKSPDQGQRTCNNSQPLASQLQTPNSDSYEEDLERSLSGLDDDDDGSGPQLGSGELYDASPVVNNGILGSGHVDDDDSGPKLRSGELYDASPVVNNGILGSGHVDDDDSYPPPGQLSTGDSSEGDIHILSQTSEPTFVEAFINSLCALDIIVGDGNCLCRALAMIALGDQNKYMAVKDAIADALDNDELVDVWCNNPSTFVYNAKGLPAKKRGETPVDYLKRCVRNDKSWLGEEIIPIFSKVFEINIMMIETLSGAFHFYGGSSTPEWVRGDIPAMLFKVGGVEAGDAHYDVQKFKKPLQWEDFVINWCDDPRYHGSRNVDQVFHLIGERMQRVAPTIITGFSDGRDLLTKDVDKRKFSPISRFCGDVNIGSIAQLCTPGSFVSTTVVDTIGVLIETHFSSQGICCLDSAFMSKWFIPVYKQREDVATIWSKHTRASRRQAAAPVSSRSSTSTNLVLDALSEATRILIPMYTGESYLDWTDRKGVIKEQHFVLFIIDDDVRSGITVTCLDSHYQDWQPYDEVKTALGEWYVHLRSTHFQEQSGRSIETTTTSMDSCIQQTECDCAIFTLANAILAALNMNDHHRNTTWWTSERILLLRYFFFAAIWMNKLDHSLIGGPKMEDVFHRSSDDVSGAVNMKNAADFTDLLRTDETPPPKIEGRSENAKRKSEIPQPQAQPKKKRIFSLETNAEFAKKLRSLAHGTAAENPRRAYFMAAKGVDNYGDIIASVEDALKVQGIGPKIASRWEMWYGESANMAASQSF